MTGMDSTTLMNQSTANAALEKARDDLDRALRAADARMTELRNCIIATRPLGLLTVDEMAEAIGRDRNYVDSVWSAYGDVTKGRQTRVCVDGDAERARMAYEAMADKAAAQKRALGHVATARAERDRVVALVYASKLLGPSAIAIAVGIDRNHVGRLARKAGIKPIHRKKTRNQYTATR